MTHLRLVLPCTLVATAAFANAQLTLINSATFGDRFATTTGALHSVDAANKMVGNASILRAPGASNSSYLNTNIALDPSKGALLSPTADPGWTIQFWYKPGNPSLFSYLFGDLTWSGASGNFRCFQNGAAGAGNLYIRGPLVQLTTTGAPLSAANLPSNGWVHLAIVQNNKANTLTWYVNGAQNSIITSTGTGVGKNLTLMGYSGSSSAGASGNYDDVRVYNFARPGGDISADYTKAATGAGPSGFQNVPEAGYYRCETSVNPHISGIGLNGDPTGPVTRLFTGGSTLDFVVDTPASSNFTALLVFNVFPGKPGMARTDAFGLPPELPGGPYQQNLIPGLKLGTTFTSPSLATWLIWPGFINYTNGTTGRVSAKIPNNINLVDGDRLDVQFVVGDPTYAPNGLGATNHMTFEYVGPKGAHSCHVEARGLNTIQETGFFEVWNTGVIKIKSVSIDLSTMANTGVTWDVGGGLNSGGTLLAGTSYRYQTDTICDLTPTSGTRYILSNGDAKLTFNFDTTTMPNGGFEGPTDHFLFDCDTKPATGNGSYYVGATVEVTWSDGTTKKGVLTGTAGSPLAEVDL